MHRMLPRIYLVFFLSTLISSNYCWGTAQKEEDKDPAVWPSIAIATNFGYKPSADEIQGRARYQDASWKEAEREIAKDPQKFREQYEAIKEEMSKK